MRLHHARRQHAATARVAGVLLDWRCPAHRLITARFLTPHPTRPAGVVEPQPLPIPNRPAIPVNTSASTRGPAPTHRNGRPRNRPHPPPQPPGKTCSNFTNARTDVSSIPATPPAAAVRNPTATATASSSSNNKGGNTPPAPNRYPPPPRTEPQPDTPETSTAQHQSASVRVDTPNRPANSRPDPVPPNLQQRQQPQQPSRRLQHPAIVSPIAEDLLPQSCSGSR
jgi:hypothetical protein